MRTRPHGSIFILLLLGFCVGRADAAEEVKGPNLLERFPRDPILAGLLTVDDLPATLDGFLGIAARFGEGELEFEAGIAEFDRKLGCSIREDLLRRIGPQLGFVVDLPPFDTLMAAMADPATGLSRALARVGIIAQVREPQAFDTCWRKLLTMGGEAVLSEADGLVQLRLPLGGPGEAAFDLFYGFNDGTIALGASADSVREALRPRAKGERLADGADYSTVAANLDKKPEILTYFNLPKVREMVKASVMLQSILAANPEGAGFFEFLLSPDFTPMGAGSTSVAVNGGTRTTTFGPSAMSGGTATAGIVAAIAIPNLLNAIDRGKQKRTMADLRSVATAVEAYSIDNNKVYPGPTGGWVPIDWLADSVTPEYIRTLPREDGWGHPLKFWSDGRRYVILSPGKDADPERDWAEGEPPGGPTTSLTADIVFANGAFLQWPQGKQD